MLASRLSSRAEIILLSLILVAAAFLRLLWLDAIPAGWHHDEALMGVMASQVYRGVQRPIFFSAYLGQEPLYIYLSAGMMWLMGGNQDILPLRLTSAMVGVATVGVTYLLGRELFNRRVGLIGASLLGLSFWQVMMSRDGCRVITQPLAEGLAIFLLWHAGRRQSAWWFAAAGAAFGGTLYTYLGARLFPGTLIVFGLWWVLVKGRPRSDTWLRLGIFLITAVIIVAPLLLFFATHPGTFSARINQVSVFQYGSTAAHPLQALVENIAKLLATFTLYGETLWRYNLPGRPIFVGLVGVLFYVGLISAIRSTLRRQAASAMLIAWFVTMLFPSFLSYDVGGYTFRSMGLVPMLYLLPALGFVGLWDWTATKVPRPWERKIQQAFVGLIVVVLLVDGAITYRDYFTIWAGSFGNDYENMADMVAGARFLAREAKPPEEAVFVSSEYYQHADIAHLAPQVYPYVRWFDGNSTLVLSPGENRDSLYVFPFSALPRDLDSYLPDEAVVERSFFSNGTTKLIAYRLTPAQVGRAVSDLLDSPSFTQTNKNLDDTIALVGYRLDQRVTQGGKLSITAIWRILADAPARDYVIFSHLLNVQGAMKAQYDTTAFPTREWRAGDIVVGQYDIWVGNGTTPGKYSVALGVYDRATLRRLSVKDSPTAEDTLSIGFVKVADGDRQYVAATVPVGKTLGGCIELEGFDLQRQPASSPLRVDLHWQAKAVPPEDYTVFVQLLNADGRLVAQSDDQPAAGQFPTSYWEAGETIIDEHELPLDKSLPAGRYSVIAGMYQLSTGQRLAVEDGSDHVLLTNIDISG